MTIMLGFGGKDNKISCSSSQIAEVDRQQVLSLVMIWPVFGGCVEETR